tara:strand:- start:235 stop:537 length:303 start_codon:yes stop_codon:yes gene_type:complete
MAIPNTGYPTTLDDTNATPSATVEFPQPASGTDLDATNVEHDILHTNLSKVVVELEKKLGIGNSPAASAANNTFLKHTGSGTTAWAAVTSTSVLEVQVFS